jgi:hypothetical protein
LVYSAADVSSSGLRSALLSEYQAILHALITSKKVYDSNNGNFSDKVLLEYMNLKRKKMS